MLRLLNFRCSFCSNSLDETQSCDALLTSRDTVVWENPRSAAIDRRDLPALTPSWIAALSASASRDRGDVLVGLSPASTAKASASPRRCPRQPRASRMPSRAHHLVTVEVTAPTAAAAALAVRPDLTSASALSLVSFAYAIEPSLRRVVQ